MKQIDFLLALPIKELNCRSLSNKATKLYINKFCQNLLKFGKNIIICDENEILKSIESDDKEFLEGNMHFYELDNKELYFKKNNRIFEYRDIAVKSIVMMNPEIITKKINKEGTNLEKIHYKIGRFYYKEEYEETNNNYVKIIGLKYKFNFFSKNKCDNYDNYFQEIYAIKNFCHKIIFENKKQLEYADIMSKIIFRDSIASKSYVLSSKIYENITENYYDQVNLDLKDKFVLLALNSGKKDKLFNLFLKNFLKYTDYYNESNLLLIIVIDEKENQLFNNNISNFLQFLNQVAYSLENFSKEHNVLFLHESVFLKHQEKLINETRFFVDLKKDSIRNYLTPQIQDSLYFYKLKPSIISSTYSIDIEHKEDFKRFFPLNFSLEKMSFESFFDFEKSLFEFYNQYKLINDNYEYITNLKKSEFLSTRRFLRDIENLYTPNIHLLINSRFDDFNFPGNNQNQKIASKSYNPGKDNLIPQITSDNFQSELSNVSKTNRGGFNSLIKKPFKFVFFVIWNITLFRKIISTIVFSNLKLFRSLKVYIPFKLTLRKVPLIKNSYLKLRNITRNLSE